MPRCLLFNTVWSIVHAADNSFCGSSASLVPVEPLSHVCTNSMEPKKSKHASTKLPAQKIPGVAADRDSRKPKLIVFDMDFTLWPFHVDTHPYPPLHKGNDGKIRDSRNSVFEPYPQSETILKYLCSEGYILGAASRTDAPPVGKQMLQLLGWETFFRYREIYPGKKLTHFAKLQKESGFKYEDMLFVDDEYRNIRDVSKLGVTCLYLEGELTHNVIQKGLKMFADGTGDK